MALLYIDAGTGGILLQVVLGGFVGGLVLIKLAAKRVVDFILRRSDDPVATTDASAEDESDSLAA
jgi:hypothetical protein